MTSASAFEKRDVTSRRYPGMVSDPMPGSSASGMPLTIDSIFRHAREGGHPSCCQSCRRLDSRFRGNDEEISISASPVRKLDFRLAGENGLAGLRGHLYTQLHDGHAELRLVDLLDNFSVEIGDIAF